MRPSLTGRAISALGVSFFVASVAGQPTQFEVSGKTIQAAIAEWELAYEGQTNAVGMV